jgi:DNA-binding winged helix-turn-helix (wHTH) protein
MLSVEPLRLRFDGFELDEADARLSCDGQPVALTPKAFGVLCALARNAPNLVTKDQLLDAVWGHQHVSESVLKTTISDLRAALSDDARQPRYIETAARRGYRFVGAVARPAPTDAAAPRPAEASPASAAPAFAATSVIIGRHAALESLQAAWQRALAGQRQLFWITGEAGVGKTTLMDHFVAGVAGGVHAHGQCVEQFGAGEPYLPVLEALAAVGRVDAALAPLMRAVAPTWLLQMPWLCSDTEREALRRELSGSSQDRMLRELGELLDQYTATQPLLLVTEDLHWSDHATLRLIDHIARRRGPARLMWLASFRLAEVIAEHHQLKTLRHELRLHRLCQEIVLDPFSERELAGYVGQRLPGAELAEDWVRLLHEHTDGLPLFVVNVVDELLAQGTLDAAPVSALPIPESLAGVIEKRIAALPEELRSLLEAASVCGVEFGPETLADALERDAAWTDRHCDTLARAQQWLARPPAVRGAGAPAVRYAFRHALYWHVFYQRVGALARVELHRRIARSMERRRAEGASIAAAELALHFEFSHQPDAAVRHYAEAAENALRHFAPTEAMQVSAHALRLLPHSSQGPERNVLEMAVVGPRAVAATQLLGVTSPETVALFERVQALYGLLPGKTARALEVGLGWAYHVRGEHAQARALAERIDGLAAQRGDRLLHASACNLLGASATLQGEPLAGRKWLEEGLATFDEVLQGAAFAPLVIDLGVSMRSRLAIALSHLGQVDRARQETEASLARADALGQPYARMMALGYAALLEVRLDRPDRVQPLADALQQVVDEHATIEGEAPARWLRGWLLARQGQAEAGCALAQEGYARYRLLGRFGGGSLGGYRFLVEPLVLAQRWAEARTQLDEAVAVTRRLGERLYLPDLLLLEARIALGTQQADAARHAMEAAAAEARAQQALWLELSARVALCELAPAAAPQDIAALKEVRGRLTEGLDTALAAKADTLLAGI